MTEKQAIERIATVLMLQGTIQDPDKSRHDAEVAWNEMKAIAREEQTPVRQWENVEALDLR